MSPLEKRIGDDYAAAFKNQEAELLAVLRLLKSVLTNESIARNRAELTDEDVVKVLRKEIKKRQDASAIFVEGGRPELAEKESAEIEIIKKYLPPELGDGEIRAAIEAVVAENNFGPGDFGKAMKLVMARIGGQADGTRVSALLKERLS